MLIVGGQMNGIALLFLLISCELYSGEKKGVLLEVAELC